MNEKSLEVLKRYDIEVMRMSRGRGGMMLATDSGTMLFLECVHPDTFYKREDIVTKAIKKCGYELVDTYVNNADGEIITEDEDGKKYILKNWFDGRECNIKDVMDICDTVRALADLHIIMDKAAPIIKKERGILQQTTKEQAWENVLKCSGTESEGESRTMHGAECETEWRAVYGTERGSESLYDTYVRHMKELKMASNYLKTKKRRQDFEILAYSRINEFYDEAKRAVEILGSENIRNRLSKCVETGELCHGSFNYHNVSFVRGGVCITNFDHVRNECQIVDLYQFMRKILEKYDWNIELAYKMIDEYDKIRMVTDADLEILAAMFAFPEKFWKIINYYFNMNKAWIPPRSIDKLTTVIEQNVKRKEFIETLFA